MAEPQSRFKTFTKKQVRIFLAGASVVVPLAITIVALYYSAIWVDGVVRKLFPEQIRSHLPDMKIFGLVVALTGIYFIGLMSRVVLFNQLVRVVEWFVGKVPLAKSLYEGVRDLLRFFGGSGEEEKMGRVVKVTLADGEVRMLGILTNDNPRGLGEQSSESPAEMEGDKSANDPPDPQRVAVYLPMSYQLGGFTVYVGRDQVEPVDMTVEEAMKIAATADVG